MSSKIHVGNRVLQITTAACCPFYTGMAYASHPHHSAGASAAPVAAGHRRLKVRSPSGVLWCLRPLLLQDADAAAAAKRLRLSLADRDYSQTRAVVALVQDLGDTVLLQAPAPAAALAPSQANTVSLALADVVDHDLQSRCLASALHSPMQDCSSSGACCSPTQKATTPFCQVRMTCVPGWTSPDTCQTWQVLSQIQLSLWGASRPIATSHPCYVPQDVAADADAARGEGFRTRELQGAADCCQQR